LPVFFGQDLNWHAAQQERFCLDMAHSGVGLRVLGSSCHFPLITTALSLVGYPTNLLHNAPPEDAIFCHFVLQCYFAYECQATSPALFTLSLHSCPRYLIPFTIMTCFWGRNKSETTVSTHVWTCIFHCCKL